jgi:hypothetical protein
MDFEIDEEIEALRSIYGPDFEDCPKVWNCPSFIISCKACQEHAKVSARLKFTLSKKYPQTKALVDIVETAGLTPKEIAQLKEMIENELNDCLGSVMCYNLTTCCTAFLESHVPKPGTLYEDMLQRETKEKKALEKIVSSHSEKKDITPSRGAEFTKSDPVWRRTSDDSESSDNSSEKGESVSRRYSDNISDDSDNNDEQSAVVAARKTLSKIRTDSSKDSSSSSSSSCSSTKEEFLSQRQQLCLYKLSSTATATTTSVVDISIITSSSSSRRIKTGTTSSSSTSSMIIICRRSRGGGVW